MVYNEKLFAELIFCSSYVFLKLCFSIESIFVHGGYFVKYSLLDHLTYSQNFGRVDFYYF